MSSMSYEEIAGFTSKELADLEANQTVLNMYDNYVTGIISEDEYKNFLLKCASNYCKDLLKQHHRTMSKRAEYEDFRQAGYLAVLEHFKEFNPYKGKLTTFFKTFINSAMKKTGSTNDESKHYVAVLGELNKVAQAYGFTDCTEVPVQTLARLCPKHSPRTIYNALEYKSSTLECSFEALTENQDFESPFENPESIMIRNELKDSLAMIMSNATSLEKYVLSRVYLGDEDGATSNFSAVTKEFTDENFRKRFTDDEISTKKKIDTSYIEKRMQRLFARLKNNPIIRTYGSQRERVLFQVSDEQATASDISNAFAIGDLFD